MVFKAAIFFQVTFLLVASSPAFGPKQSGARIARRSANVMTAQPVPTSITWTQLLNCQVSNGTLQKSAGCNGCADAHAVSSQALAAGDGYMQFNVDNTATDRYCGLSYQGN